MMTRRIDLVRSEGHGHRAATLTRRSEMPSISATVSDRRWRSSDGRFEVGGQVDLAINPGTSARHPILRTGDLLGCRASPNPSSRNAPALRSRSCWSEGSQQDATRGPTVRFINDSEVFVDVFHTARELSLAGDEQPRIPTERAEDLRSTGLIVAHP